LSIHFQYNNLKKLTWSQFFRKSAPPYKDFIDLKFEFNKLNFVIPNTLSPNPSQLSHLEFETSIKFI